MAEKFTEDAGKGIPEWLARYREEALAYMARGEEPPLTVEQVAQAAGVPAPGTHDHEEVPKAKGITPRPRADGYVFEVRHRGKTVGTFDTFEEALAAKEEVKNV